MKYDSMSTRTNITIRGNLSWLALNGLPPSLFSINEREIWEIFMNFFLRISTNLCEIFSFWAYLNFGLSLWTNIEAWNIYEHFTISQRVNFPSDAIKIYNAVNAYFAGEIHRKNVKFIWKLRWDSPVYSWAEIRLDTVLWIRVSGRLKRSANFYENRSSGILWIVLSWSKPHLDTKTIFEIGEKRCLQSFYSLQRLVSLCYFNKLQICYFKKFQIR